MNDLKKTKEKDLDNHGKDETKNVSDKKIHRLLDRLRLSWISIWLIVIGVIFAITASYAAYMGVTTSKRVISLHDRDGMLFSSRYMAAGGTSVQEQGIASGTADPTVTVNVANTDREGLSTYGKVINFKLKARLVDKATGNELASDPNVTGYTVYCYDGAAESDSPTNLTLTNSWQYFGISSPTSDAAGAYSFSLPGGTATNLYFNVHFPASELENPTYAVELVAETTDGYDDIKNISGKIAVTSRTSTSVEWSGYYADNQTERTPADYDAYNYTISGAGTGTIALTYDSDYVVLDKNDKAVFKALSGATETTSGSKITITFPVDTTAENAVSYYAIKFYRAGQTDTRGNELVMSGFTDAYIKTVYTPTTSED